jgi:rhamnogalacturonyl hydrolase YesR
VNNYRDIIMQSALKVEKWVEDHDYKGYEPFDGLSSKYRPLTFGNLLLDRILLQLIRQSPINLRPLFGVKPLESTIGRGYMAWGYCHMFKITRDDSYRKKAFSCLDWLIEKKSPGYTEFSWGKHFDFASRGGLYRKHEPILIWTALIGHAFMEAYEEFGEKKYLDVSKSVCDWILNLPKNEFNSGICLAYLMKGENSNIHNSNMMGAALLARTSKFTDQKEYSEVAQKAMDFSCSCQLTNGAWWYGEHPKYHWIDNFHTGYNLDALKCYVEYSGDKSHEDKINPGLKFYKEHLFEENGRPKYYHNRAYPIDSQCAAQAIETLATFSNDKDAEEIGRKVSHWTIENMQDEKGHFYYRQYPIGIKAKTPMLHWAQATMYKGLTMQLLVLNKSY